MVAAFSAKVSARDGPQFGVHGLHEFVGSGRIARTQAVQQSCNVLRQKVLAPDDRLARALSLRPDEALAASQIRLERQHLQPCGIEAQPALFFIRLHSEQRGQDRDAGDRRVRIGTLA
jgi:hypothetical protein